MGEQNAKSQVSSAEFHRQLSQSGKLKEADAEVTPGDKIMEAMALDNVINPNDPEEVRRKTETMRFALQSTQGNPVQNGASTLFSGLSQFVSLPAGVEEILEKVRKGEIPAEKLSLKGGLAGIGIDISGGEETSLSQAHETIPTSVTNKPAPDKVVSRG